MAPIFLEIEPRGRDPILLVPLERRALRPDSLPFALVHSARSASPIRLLDRRTPRMPPPSTTMSSAFT